MGKVQKPALILFVFSLLVLLSLSASAQPANINSFTGNVSIGASSASASGAVVEAFIGSSSTADKSYTVGSRPDAVGAGRYILDFECSSGSIAFLKVWGINATWQTCNTLTNETNLSVSLTANDASCSYSNGCSSGFCCDSSTQINTSGGSGVCQAVTCGTGITVPGFTLNSTSVINTQTVNFTINISSQLRYNITAANFTLVSNSGVVSRNFTIPSNGRNFNISYEIFASSEPAVPGTYNITAVQLNDNGSITNRTTITTMNFTVASRLTVPNFALSAASITTAQTVNFTINLSNTYYNITSANFTLVTGSTVVSRNFTIPSNSRNLNISYKIFASSETASAGTYNITAVQINDNGSIVNRTAITNMNFTVTAVAAAAADTGGGGGGAGGGGGGGAAPAAPAAPSEETKVIVKEALPEAFKVADAAGNVEIKTVAAPEVKEVPVAAETVTKTLEQLETIVKTEEAKQALSAIQEAVSSGGATTVAVKKTIEVVKATNKVTKEEIVVSVVKLSVTAPGSQDLKNVEVVEVIPKAAASNVNQVTFKGDQPQVLEADPVVKWFFTQVVKGTTKDLSYTVNKDIRTIGTTTVGTQGRAEAAPAAPEVPPAPPVGEKEEAAPPVVKKPTPLNTVIMVVVLAVVVVAGWFFLKVKGRKKVMK